MQTPFKTLTGLDDEGPHRAYADYLLFPIPLCHTCAGRGYVGVYPGLHRCGPCGGGGRVFRPDAPEIAEIVRKVREFFPRLLPDIAMLPDEVFERLTTRQAPAPAAAPQAAPAVPPRELPTCFSSIHARREAGIIADVRRGVRRWAGRLWVALFPTLSVWIAVMATCLAVEQLAKPDGIALQLLMSPVCIGLWWLALEKADWVARRWGTLTTVSQTHNYKPREHEHSRISKPLRF